MSVKRAHRNLSRWVHNLIWDDKDQALCSRAFYRAPLDWRWRIFRLVVDFLAKPFEPRHWRSGRPHCRRSYDRYW